MAEVRRIFQSYDKDENGFVTIDEAHDILEKVGPVTSRTTCYSQLNDTMQQSCSCLPFVGTWLQASPIDQTRPKIRRQQRRTFRLRRVRQILLFCQVTVSNMHVCIVYLHQSDQLITVCNGFSAEELRLLFEHFDEDKSQSLSLPEVKVMLRQLGMRESDLDVIVEMYDKDQDGELQYKEFAHFLSTMQ